MATDLLLATAALWAFSLFAALLERSGLLARITLSLGCCSGMAACVLFLPSSSPVLTLGFQLADTPVFFQLSGSACWLMFFGLATALFACILATPAHLKSSRCYWLAALSLTLLGALGVFGLQDAMSFLIAWEVMSVGGAAMLLGEAIEEQTGMPALFMLTLLECGAVALLLALLLLGNRAGSMAFTTLGASTISGRAAFAAGLLLLCGFGAKLGILPFYEWFPRAYGSASGATGVIFSGIVLNAAFFALARGTLHWLPRSGHWVMAVAVIMLMAGVLSAILAIFNAFQEEDWRRMLSLSSAESAGIAVAMLGMSLLFATISLPGPAALAWMVCLMHLAGHSLAKGALLLTSDGVYSVSGSYSIRQSGILRGNSIFFGIGALFAAMSLAALPPQAGFVSEWYAFQTLFQGMQIHLVPARLAITLAAAGVALVAAVALATFAKLFGVGLLGHENAQSAKLPRALCGIVFLLGLGVLALAVGMPWWIQPLGAASQSLFHINAPAVMRDGWVLVPLSGKFAFISPTKLVLVCPLLALLPITLFFLSRRLFRLRRAPLWSGGRRESPRQIATTSLAFSNALRTFYSFIYGPTHNLERESDHGPYFIKRLIFNQELVPVFEPHVFAPIAGFVRKLADRVGILQSGYLNFYNALIGMLLVLILVLTLFYK